MAGALDQHAEKAYAELDTARQRQICQKLFRAITDKATDPRGIRRPTTLGTLCALADATEAEVIHVIDVFRRPSRSFLMPPVGEPLETGTVIDISHESLMRVWNRLKDWSDKEAFSAQRFQRLAETAKLHEEDKAALWGDPDLQLALDWRTTENPNETWANRYGGGFDAAMSFLNKSKEVRDSETAEATLNYRWRIPRGFIAAFVLGLYFGFGVGFGDDLWYPIDDKLYEIVSEQTAYVLFGLFQLTVHFSIFAALTHVGKRIYRYVQLDGLKAAIANDTLSARAEPVPEQTYAPFWRRFLAGLIDLLVWYTLLMVTGVTMFELLNLDSVLNFWVGSTLLFAPIFLYDVLLTSSSRQATLGKMALGLFVTDTNGDRVSFLRATARFFLRFFFVGYLIQPFFPKKQTLHDMGSNCLVYHLPRKHRLRAQTY
jgi:uncharacterized RDD family membrane protein YckC